MLKKMQGKKQKNTKIFLNECKQQNIKNKQTILEKQKIILEKFKSNN